MEKTAFENPTCMCCGNDLVLIQEDEDSGKREYKCPYCGTIYLFYPCDEEEQENYAYYNDEIRDNFNDVMFGYKAHCPQCGSYVVLQDSNMRSEVLNDVNDDDDCYVNYFSCLHCGASIEVIDAKPSEYKDYPAFQKKEDEEENYD
jgi:DNA-directed RNA polymerase subunit RPC12/RpoP/ribosomal protein S27AE